MELDSFKMFIDLLKITIVLSLPFLILLFIKSALEKFIKTIFLSTKIKNAGINEINKMTGREFEIFLKCLFEKLGYKVKLLKGYKDHGADLIIYNDKNTKIVVQAKKLNNGYVGVKAIGEVLRGMSYYKCQKALIVTNQYYTEQAKHEAEKFGIILWDRNELIKQLNKLQNKSA